MNLLAEQNMDLMEEIVSLKKGMKGSFEQLAEDFGNTMNEMNERAEERDVENKEIIRKLTEKIDQFENNSRNAFIALSKCASPHSGPSTEKACSEPVVPEPQAVPYPAPSQEPVVQRKRKSKYLQKTKVLFIADSVGRNVEFSKLERTSNVRITTKKAYSSVKNKNAKWPELNVMDVTRKEVNNVAHGDDYDVVVLSAPTVDITNLDTVNVKASENIEFFKQEVVISTKNMISAAENALKSNPSIKKAIILGHPPRFDTPEVDPLMLKQTLAKVSNNLLYQLWLDSPLKDRMFIGEHKLECSPRTRIDRFTDEKTKMFDGVHMFGKSGRTAYTESILSVFRDALSSQTERPSSSPRPVSPPHCPPPASPAVSSDPDDHKYCPQAIYAAGYKARQSGYPKYHHSVQNKNRFSVFNTYQGNM